MEHDNKNGYTSLGQSELLVRLGVDPNTADMHHRIEADEWYDTSLCYDADDARGDGKYVPCWSLNALINMFPSEVAAPYFVLTRGGISGKTAEYSKNWFAQWEDDNTYLVYNDPNAVCAVVKLLVKLIQDKRIKL